MPYSKATIVPDTTASQAANATPLDSASQSVQGYMSMIAIGDTCFVMFKAGGTPSCQEVIDGGFPLLEGVPVSLQPVDEAGSPAGLQDPSQYWLAKAGAGAGDVRAIA